MFNDEGNPSKIFKIASNSFKAIDVPFLLATTSTVVIKDALRMG